jgi:site-specific DNA-methyltransferase (adenine-specific)
MGIFDKNKFDSVKQDWATHWDFFNPLNKEFNFTVDAAADSVNCKIKKYWNKQMDGLKQDWSNEIVWCNPPYGRNVPEWLKKGKESAKCGCTSVFLIPARTNTIWFHNLCLTADEIRFVKGRPKFYNFANIDKEAIHGLPVPLCLVIYKPNSTYCKINSYDWKK